MFGWFSPQCPVDIAAKRWIEERLGWLSSQFGRDVFTRRAVILPTEEFFPDHMDGTEASVRTLLNRVCRYMDADPDSVRLELFTKGTDLWLVNDSGQYLPTGAAGLYDEQPGETVIHIETSGLFDLSNLVGTMAHELAHQRLMGEKRVTGNEFDNELLTDLTAVFHGFGIFLGNCPRNWDSQYGKWPGTDLRRPEYMTLPMFAYALAHSAWHRDLPKPDWSKYLSFELRPCFKQGVRYLQNTGDSTFAPSRNL
ncbi:MAG: hypothetical protein KDA86_18235 [Planctomycetaceae bacterium]|nr:hypothetical protein [Planctomycetaceae bacterium]